MTEVSGNVYRIQYQDRNAVYNSYMSFLKDKGLFVPSKEELEIGKIIQLFVMLPEHPDNYMVSGKVSWINFGRKKGFGVHFIKNEQSITLCNAIETMIIEKIGSVGPTYTM